MSKRSHFKPVYLATILALLFSATFTFNVVADDPTPAPATPDVTETPPVEEPTPVPTQEPIITPEEQVATLLDALPDNTTIVVTVDEEIIPLVTNQATDAILVGDPIWCPDGIMPQANLNGCTDSYPDLESLLNDVNNAVIPEPSANGTIWIMAGTDASGVDLQIDGTNFTIWSNFTLTLQGGWDGTSSGNITGTSTFSVPLSVTGWNNNVTLNQIIVDGALGSGITIDTTGDIAFQDVTASNNDNYGAELYTSGNVTLTGTNTFNTNGNSGLYINAGGDITADNITANDNDFNGAELITLNDIILTGTNTFNNNTDSGLYAQSVNTQAENITADGNGVYGAELQSTGFVSVTGTNVFNDNTDSGLIVTAADINAENITANGNGGSGADLNSTNDIALTGTNQFNSNTASGVLLDSGNNIDAENLSADDNGTYGAELLAQGNINVIGTNIFTNNVGSGIYIDGIGTIYLENISGDENGGFGAEIYSADQVTVSGNNQFNGNTGSGLVVEATGNIETENLNTDGNGVYGAELYTQGNINVLGTNIFTNNTGSGLYIEGLGIVYLENIAGSDNGGLGAEIFADDQVTLSGSNQFDGNVNSGLYIESGSDIEASNLSADGNGVYGAELQSQGNVNLLGTNIFTNNTNSGIYIEGLGTIDLANITASDNGAVGTDLLSGNAVTLTGSNIFNGNVSSGLYIDAAGDIQVENISADGNGAGGSFSSGAELYTTSGSVSVTGTNVFTNNYSDGLTVGANGDISVSNITATDNGLSGTYLETDGNAEITCGVYSDNAGPEIEADTGGALILNGVDFGDDIDNEIAADNLVLNSNSCYTYPDFSSGGSGSNGSGNNSSSGATTGPALPELPIHEVATESGQDVGLICDIYKGTLITLPDGDGAYIPCPIIDDAQLFDIGESTLPLGLPQGYTYLDSFLLAIFVDGTALGPLNVPGSIWYASPEQIQNAKVQVFYWDGTQWVEITDRITPFMQVFFEITPELKNENLAIMYWDGTKWIEIAEPGHLGNGYIIKTGGHISGDGLYFEATLNFTGTFVLVKK